MSAFRRPALSVGAAVIGLAAATVAIAPASADSLECGDEISVDTVLTTDLTCGAGDGLEIVANGVTLDLGGHTITGPGAYGQGAGAGVRVTQRTGVTVMHGTITGYQTAVIFNESRDGHVTRLTVHHNDQGIILAGGGDHLVDKNVAAHNGRDAINLGLSEDNRVTQNTVSDNVYGIAVTSGSTDNTVDRNVASGNEYFGIAAFGGGSGNIVEKNQVSGSVHHGIQVNSDIAGITLLQNYLSGNGDDGIHVETTNATLTKNTAVYNGDLGISAPVGVTDGGGNKASGNGNVLQCTGVVCNPAF
jgi:parallel beta-helix repeat protein